MSSKSSLLIEHLDLHADVSLVLNTSAQVLHSSPLPEKAAQKQAIVMLQDHVHFLRCDPHMASFKPTTSEEAKPAPLPDRIKALGETSSYEVVDVLHTLPAGIWDSNVVSKYEFTNIELGVFVRIRSPLNVVMDTTWEIKEGKDGKLELVEDVSMSCSRLLIGIVKGQCESGWLKIHALMMDRLKKELEGQSATNGTAAAPA